ncbi:hypothetical protein IZ6_24760 [Terrihabitans soli]|uniref:Calcineurin-like phosphoesterase domain-containing protein n=1 Tax=Terrihabitans soli TaxID=708113 RepID=A0A6S6QXJ1_9HYPH|nr:metallophosphoesterase [Terrihabitans soli]BCJ91741.1 hypothetical protein IZ6_24760 [Terrihabitans soli]
MNIDWLGDPHLGRSFINGVPLHRRGEREALVRAAFRRSLIETTARFHVCVGDLFDKPIVSYDTIMFAVETYREAAAKNRGTAFVVIRGNHDASRDLERVSAFDLFKAMMAGVPNVSVLTDQTNIGGISFCPWHPTKTAAEVAAQVSSCNVAVGHWDVDGQGSNLIPTDVLADRGIVQAFTGHVHKPDQFKRHGVDVTVVGSMLPYAHGEEINDDLYVTTNLEAVKADPGSFRNKIVRIDLKPGELFDIQLDCLQLQVRRPEEVEEALTVEFDGFDMQALFTKAFDAEGVPAPLREMVLGKYEELRSKG